MIEHTQSSTDMRLSIDLFLRTSAQYLGLAHSGELHGRPDARLLETDFSNRYEGVLVTAMDRLDGFDTRAAA